MKPKSPFTQPFEALPDRLPLYPLENALLPGGQLPLEASEPWEIAMFFDAIKADQIIGLIQPKSTNKGDDLYKTGCAGRIRQWRERKDGRINIMITGFCRYKIKQELPEINGYRQALCDWNGFAHDYDDEQLSDQRINDFKNKLNHYFERQRMQVDWDSLNKLPIEDVVNNLVLVLNFTVEQKQFLLESATLDQRLNDFTSLIEQKDAPIWVGEPQSKSMN